MFFNKMSKLRSFTSSFICATVVVYFVSACLSAAADTNPEKKKTRLKEFAVLFGFGHGDLADEKNYDVVPILMRFGFDLNPLLKKSGKDPKQMAEFAAEPFISPIISPDTNVEAGINFLFKYGRFIAKKFCLYVEAGTGPVYMTQHVKQQSTQFNFASQIGAGVHYFIKENLAFDIGYRRRHVSNCSVKRPNRGIDTDTVLVGVSWFFN